MKSVTTLSFVLKNVSRWSTIIDLEYGPMISHDHARNSMNSYARIVFPAPAVQQRVRTCDQVMKIILPSPGHHNISDAPSRQFLNSRDLRSHSPVLFFCLCMNSF